jgi:hypothetical protein
MFQNGAGSVSCAGGTSVKNSNGTYDYYFISTPTSNANRSLDKI